MTRATQKTQIKSYLEEGNRITPLDALEKFGCFRLAAVIHILREEGMTITTDMHTYNGKTYAVYEYFPEGDEPKKKERNWMLPDWG